MVKQISDISYYYNELRALKILSFYDKCLSNLECIYCYGIIDNKYMYCAVL